MTTTMEIKQKEDHQCGDGTDPTCCNSGYSCWQTPPADIMEKILRLCFTTLADHVRLSIVCKSWKSIIMRRDIRAAAPPLFPWLLPPPPSDYSKKYLTFPRGGQGDINFKLPKRIRGGWIYGSSKGWLIIVKERGLNSKMFLFNPISRALHHLPSLRTIPSFKKVIKTRKWERFGAKEFCCHVALAIHTNMNFSESLTVAAVFNDRKILGVCRPGDKAWIVTQVLDINENCFLHDVLFSSDTLYALVRSQKEDGVVDASTRTINVGFGDNPVELKLKLVYDKHEIKNKRILQHRDGTIVPNGTYNSMLLESSHSEVILIHQMLDFSLKTTDEGEEGNDNIDGIGGNIVDDNEDSDQDDSGDEANNEDHVDDYDNGDDEIENDNGDDTDGTGCNIVDDNEDSDPDSSGDEANNEDHVDDYDNGDEDTEDYYVDEDGIIRGNDEFEGEGNGNEEDNTIDENAPGFNPELRTSNFKVYKIDTEKHNLTRLQSIGDQIFFCGNDCSFSLPSSPYSEESTKSSIYFARNSVWDFEVNPETYTSREIGFFNFDEGKGVRFPTKRDMSVRYQGSWFTPRL